LHTGSWTLLRSHLVKATTAIEGTITAFDRPVREHLVSARPRRGGHFTDPYDTQQSLAKGRSTVPQR
jgi:hypothetical protein